MEQVNRKCQVVLLTAEKSRIQLATSTLHLVNSETASPYFVPKHIYILSSEEIKEGDWITNFEKVAQVNILTINDPNLPNCRKIIASTDDKLVPIGKVSKINQDFINKYISEYNKGNIIKEVIVEYEKDFDLVKNGFSPKQLRKVISLKLRKDNTIIIHPVKDSFTKEEVINKIDETLRKAWKDGALNNNWYNRWIENKYVNQEF